MRLYSQLCLSQVPHHPERSWYQYCTVKGRKVIDRARNKAFIASRKASSAQHEKSSSSSRPTPVSEDVLTNVGKISSSPSAQIHGLPSNAAVSHTTSTTNYVAEDLAIIIQYLRNGIPEDTDDDQIFRQLAAEVVALPVFKLAQSLIPL